MITKKLCTILLKQAHLNWCAFCFVIYFLASLITIIKSTLYNYLFQHKDHMQKIIRIILPLCFIVHALQSSDQTIVQQESKKISSHFGLKTILDYDGMLPQFLRELNLPATTTAEEFKSVLHQRRNMTITEQIEHLQKRANGFNQQKIFLTHSYNQKWVDWAKDSVTTLVQKNPNATLEQLNSAIQKERAAYRYFCIDYSLYKDRIMQGDDSCDEKKKDKKCNVAETTIMQRIFAFILLERLNRFGLSFSQLDPEQLKEYKPVSMQILLAFNPDEN